MVVKKGDLIMTAEAYAYALEPEFQEILCDTCITMSEDLKKCSNCKYIRYCSKECQKKGWAAHKKECFYLNQLIIKDYKVTKEAVLQARILMRLKKKNDTPDETEGLITETKIKTFYDLCSHEDAVMSIQKLVMQASLELTLLKRFFQNKLQISKQQFKDLFCRIHANAFPMQANTEQYGTRPVGTVIYLAPSAFDHSCRPNAMTYSWGTKLYVRSAITWDTFDPSEVRIDYFNKSLTLLTTPQRRDNILWQYSFVCECELCNDIERDQSMSSIQCGNKDCDAAVYVDEELPEEEPIGACFKCCYNSFKPNTRKKYYELVKLTKDIISKKEVPDYDTIKSLIKKQEKLFHSLNLWGLNTLEKAMKSCDSTTLMFQGYIYALKAQKTLLYYVGDHTVSYKYAVFLYNLATYEVHLHFVDNAKKLYTEAKNIILRTNGVNDVLVKSINTILNIK